MRVWACLVAAGAIGAAVLGLTGTAGAAGPTGELVCPPAIDGMPVYSSFLHEGDLGLRSTLDCEYGSQMSDGTAGDAAYLVVAWDATVDAGGEDGFTSMCTGAPDSIAEPSEISRWSADLQVLDSMMVSPTKRAAASVRTWDYWDPPRKVDHEAFADVARDLLAVAETRALDCGVTPRPSEATGPSSSNRRTAGVLLAAGAGLTVLSGVGSVVAGRRPRVPVAPASAPAPEMLYSGPEAIRILQEAGLLQPVRGEDGSLIGYRPVGDLQRFIDQAPQWQPRFGKPVKTPGGTATHLGAVAFQERPDGLIGDLTIAVREAPAARTAYGGSQAGAAGAPGAPAGQAGPSAPDVQPPGEPLAERLGRAWARSQAYGVPFETALNAPDTPVQLGPAQPPAQPQEEPGPAPTPDPSTASNPPTSPDQVPAWLTTPGWKSIKPSDIFRMFPQHFGPGGAITTPPYAGSVPKVTIHNGSFTVEVNSDSLFVPDVKVRGTLAPSPSGHSLVPTLEEVTLGDQPYGDRLEHQRSLADRLNKLTEPVGDAGLRFGEVRMDGGQIEILVERP